MTLFNVRTFLARLYFSWFCSFPWAPIFC